MFDSLTTREVKQVFWGGEKYRRKYLNIIVKNNIAHNKIKFAVAIRGKIKANKRNQIKRKIREIIRINKPHIKKNKNIVILTDEKILSVPFRNLEKIIMESFKEINLV